MAEEFIPYGRQVVDDDDIAAVTRVLRSDFLTTGPAVAEFESALSSHVGGVPVVAVNSGTAALHTAYAAAGVGKGADVLTSPLTFAATAVAALHLGASVTFADVDDDTLTLDPAAAEDQMRRGIRVVAPVDFAGHPADIHALERVAQGYGAIVVEDAAHSLGSRWRGEPVGSLAAMTTFSFHPVKTVTTAEGGAVAVRDRELLDGAQRFRNHGLVREPHRLVRADEGDWHQEVQSPGLNYRMPDVLAALGTSQLSKLGRFSAQRAALVSRYHELLRDCSAIRLPTTRPDAEPVWHLFTVRVLDGRRREVFDRLRAAGIGVQVHYLPVHLHPLFQELGYRAGSCPVSEQAYAELLSLPLHPQLTNNQQDRVVHELRSALGC